MLLRQFVLRFGLCQGYRRRIKLFARHRAFFV